MSEKDNKSSIVETHFESADEQSSDNQYRIFDYFKEHPSSFITAASVFVAVISVFLNLAAFLSFNSYLNYFNIDNIVYKQSTKFVYFFAIALAFSTIIILFQSFIAQTFESYLPHKKEFLFYKYRLKSINETQRENNRWRKKARNSLTEYLKTSPEDDTTQQVKEDLNSSAEKAEQIKRDYISVKKALRKSRMKYHILIGISCLLTSFVLCIVCTLMLLFASYNWKETALSSIIVSTVYVFVCSVENWFLICVIQIKRKEIKADAQRDEKSRLSKYNDFDKFPIISLFEGDFRYIFNDSNCKKIVISVVLCLLVLIFISAWSGFKSASNQKDFFIVNIENQLYAMIYNNGENMVFEKAEIIDDTITIDSNHQKIISSTNIDMKKYVFNKVDLIREEHYLANEQETINVTAKTANDIGGN